MAGASRALGLRAGEQVWGGERDLNSGAGRAPGPRVTVLYEPGWGSGGDHFAFSSPKKKIKLEGGGENSQPHFLPWFPRKDRGQGGQGEGAGRSGPIAVNRSRPPPGRGAGPPGPPPLCPLPRGPGPAGEAGVALPAPPASPRPPGPGLWGWGWGGGSLPENPPAGLAAGGRGWKSGNGGLRRTRARHEHGPREGSWVKSGRAAPGERGEEPGSEVRALEPRVQSPPRERSEQEEPFCFRSRQHAPPLTELLSRAAPYRIS